MTDRGGPFSASRGSTLGLRLALAFLSVALAAVALLAGLATVVLVVRSWRNRPTPALADGIQPARGPELEQFRSMADKETEL